MDKQFTMTVNGTTWRVYNGSIEENAVYVAEGRSNAKVCIRKGGVYANKSGIRKAIEKLIAERVEAEEKAEVETDSIVEDAVVAEPETEEVVEVAEEPVEAEVAETASEQKAPEKESFVAVMIRNLPKYVVKKIEDIGYFDGVYRISVKAGDVVIELENKNWNAFKEEVKQACK